MRNINVEDGFHLETSMGPTTSKLVKQNDGTYLLEINGDSTYFEGIEGPGIYVEFYLAEEDASEVYKAKLTKITLENEGIEFTPEGREEPFTGYTSSFSHEGVDYNIYVLKMGDFGYTAFSGEQSGCTNMDNIYISEIKQVADIGDCIVSQIYNHISSICQETYKIFENVFNAKESGYYGYEPASNTPFKGRFIINFDTPIRGELRTSYGNSGSYTSQRITVYETTCELTDESGFNKPLSNLYYYMGGLYRIKYTTVIDGGEIKGFSGSPIYNVQYYEVNESIPYVKDIVPGVSYNRRTKIVSYNNTNMAIDYDFSGKTQDEYGVVEEFTWEEFGMTRDQFEKYLFGFENKVGGDWYNIRLDGEEVERVSVMKCGWVIPENMGDIKLAASKAPVVNGEFTWTVEYRENNAPFIPNAIGFYPSTSLGYMIVEDSERGRFVTFCKTIVQHEA